MRATLILVSVFVSSLVTTSALAEKPGGAAHKERSARVSESKLRDAKVQELRARGDVLERFRSARTQKHEKIASDPRAARLDRSDRRCTPDGGPCPGTAARGDRSEKSKAPSAADRAKGKAMKQRLQKMICEKHASNCEANL